LPNYSIYRNQEDKPILSGNAPRWALVCLFVLAVLYTLYFARDLLLPIFVAALFATLLHPLLRPLNRIRIPDSLGAIILLAGLIAVLTGGVSQLSDPAIEWIDRAPYLMREIEAKAYPIKRSIKEAKETTEKIEKMANLGAEESASQPKLQVEKNTLAERIFWGTQSGFLNMLIVVILVYFLLARGRFTLEHVAAALSNPERSKSLVDLLSQIQHEITRYLGTITIINGVLGVVTAITMILLDMPNPLLWGVMAGVMNFIPYVGSGITVIALTVVSYLTFQSWLRILLPPLLFLCFTALEGQLVTPMVMGARLSLNPIAVFISILFWSWMWGIFGVLLAIPILAAVKIISGKFKSLALLHALL